MSCRTGRGASTRGDAIASIIQAVEHLRKLGSGSLGLAERLSAYFECPQPLALEQPDHPVSVEEVRAMIRERIARNTLIKDAFADPAWDMILDLYAAMLERQPISVSSLCIASQAPPTTALRYIAALEKRGVFIRTPDRRDRRRSNISLAPEWADKIGDHIRRHRVVMRP